MSVPSMVHRSGNSLIVRSVVSGDALFGSAAGVVDDDDDDVDVDLSDDVPEDVGDDKKVLPECKIRRNYSCGSCDFFTQNPRHYLYHLRDVHKEKVKIYECPNCLYASKHFQKLLRHSKMVHGSARRTDKPVGRARSRKRKIVVTEDEEAEEEAVGSDEETGKSNRTQSSDHFKTKFFRCTKCTYATHMKARFTKHVKYHSMPMIKCDKCDFSTPYKWNLDRHCKNHNGQGAFRCSACNFTADIKQSLTVHEMNHHVPPVGQAAGLGVGRRRNKVGASDSAAAVAAVLEEAVAQNHRHESHSDDNNKKPKISGNKSKSANNIRAYGSDFINPDDIVSHANGNIYIKNKCKLCNYKSAWDGEMAKHELKVHNIVRPELSKSSKKTSRPVPNLIPISTSASSSSPSQSSSVKLLKAPELPHVEPSMSQKDFNEICAKSANSALRDFASLFGSEDVFKNTADEQHQQQPTRKNFKEKNASFFDKLKEKLLNGAGETCNLTCQYCGHESKCLSELSGHQKTCGKEETQIAHLPLVHTISSTRCQYCRQRCKSSADLFNHLQKCTEAVKPRTSSILEEHLQQYGSNADNKPHPMENRIFVWNNMEMPLETELYESGKQDDNVSLDLSVRTQSPLSENSSLEISSHQTIAPTVEKIPTHGNDIATAQVAQHKRVFKCPHCSFWASTASRFHVHIVGHLNKKPFECSLCAYRSNWRWDITKHIKLKSVRDPAHEKAKVLMTDETGRRNYTKYNKYLTEIPLSGGQNETSGGAGTRHKVSHHDHDTFSPSSQNAMLAKHELPKLTKAPATGEFGPLLKATLRPPPPLKAADEFFAKISSERKKSNSESRKKLWKCKKCNFRDASHEKLVEHVKGHYQQEVASSPLSNRSSPVFGAPQQQQSMDDEASDSKATAKGGQHAPFRCGHCHQVSNWKHVIQRHCRLKHSGDIRVVIGNRNGAERVEVDEQTEDPDHVDVPQLGTFKCQQCPFSNEDHDEFEAHLHDHLPKSDSIMKCYFCTYFVSQKEDLYEHLRLHGIVEPEDYMSKMLEKTSAETDTGKRYKCMTCPYVTNSKSQFLYHKQFHKPRGGQYVCTYCSYNVSKRHLLHQHLKVHGINVTPQKQNGEIIDLDMHVAEETPESTSNYMSLESQKFVDIPLVWVSKNDKFAKMFKCRFCPHVNLRKVNIQEHEKMHGIRDKTTKGGDSEHHCTECNYVCNNAGVLSSHSKVHQGMYGQIHCLVDSSKTDDEQIRELSRFINYQTQKEESCDESDETLKNDENTSLMLYFCQQCPARFLKQSEFTIHVRFHGVRVFYKCTYCNYATRQNSHLLAHKKVHSYEYQERTKVLQSTYDTHPDYTPPDIVAFNRNGNIVWVVKESDEEDFEIPAKIPRLQLQKQTVPISGTELYQQKQASLNPDPQFGSLMHGNPDFIYPTYLKNGRVKEKRYKCHKCPSAFEKREQYKVHLTLHGAKQRYNCEHCDYSVKYYANYVQHVKKHQMNSDAHTSRQFEESDQDEEQVEEEEEVEDPRPLKLTIADRQALMISKKSSTINSLKDSPIEEKKPFWCAHCPYTNSRKDSVENHQRRHINVSGLKSNFTCGHCDYSVPQAHFLKEHTKLHFVGFNKIMQPEAYMVCDNFKLTARNDEGESEKCEMDEVDENVIFEDLGTDAKDSNRFVPDLDYELIQKLNNNNNEEKTRQFVNTDTGEILNGIEDKGLC